MEGVPRPSRRSRPEAATVEVGGLETERLGVPDMGGAEGSWSSRIRVTRHADAGVSAAGHEARTGAPKGDPYRPDELRLLDSAKAKIALRGRPCWNDAMAHDWRVERDGARWRIVRVCDDGYKAVFSPAGDPELDRFETRAAALQMAATLNAMDAEACFRP